jgi:hypothetical protein
VAQRIPGRLETFQTYNDSWSGWPVLPLKRQHPIRGSFLDPRPDRRRGAIYHEGVDVAVRDDRPEQGAPPGRTHRVYAVEGGRRPDRYQAARRSRERSVPAKRDPSPACQSGTAVRSVGGSAGVPSSRSSLKMNVIRSPFHTAGTERHGERIAPRTDGAMLGFVPQPG